MQAKQNIGMVAKSKTAKLVRMIKDIIAEAKPTKEWKNWDQNMKAGFIEDCLSDEPIKLGISDEQVQKQILKQIQI